MTTGIVDTKMGKTMTVPQKNKSRMPAAKSRMTTVLMLIALPISMLGPRVAGADWQFDPSLRAAWDTDDNATLSPRTDEEIDLSGYIAEASLGMVYTSDRSYLSMLPIFRSRDYGNDIEEKAWNTDDQFFELYGIFDGDKNSLRIFGDYGREQVRTAEVADASLDTDVDPDTIADDQTGIINTSQRRERFRISPRWTHNFSGTSSLESQLSYQQTDYDDPDGVQQLFDFTDISLRMQYRRRMSPRTTTLVSLSARDYNSDRFGGDRQSYELAVGFVRSLSQTAQLRARIGIESVDEEDVGLPTVSIDPEPTLELTYSQRLETINILAQYWRRVNASGRGTLTARDELYLRFTRDLNDRVSVGLGARAYTSETISGFSNSQDFVQIRGQVVWRISRSFAMQADYRHSVFDRDLADGAADSNRFTLWLSWQPNPVGRDDRMQINL